MTFGKVIGGGLPAAAFGGRADVMALLAPVGPVYQAGTLSGNPLATLAGLTTLGSARDDVYARLDAAADEVGRLASRGAGRRRACRTCCSAPGTCSASSSSTPVTRCRTTPTARTPGAPTATRPFFHAMLDPGVSLPPSRRSRPGSSRPRTTTRALERVADALPAAARRPPRRDRRTA